MIKQKNVLIKLIFPANYTGSIIKENGLYKKPIDFMISSEKIKYSNNYDINSHYSCLANIKNNDKNTLIRGIVPCWDNFPRHTNLTSKHHIQLESNSLLFYLLLIKQFIILDKESKNNNNQEQLLFINSLNEWGEQCVMEPSIQYDYSFLNALKLAKQTNLSMVNEELLNELIKY